MPKNKLVVWLRAMRAFSFTATLIPVCLAGVMAFGQGAGADWILFPFILFGGLCINAASDLTNEYYDFKLGIDRKGVTGSSGVLIEGSLKPQNVLYASRLFYLLAIILGAYFVYIRGPWMAVVIAAGLLAGWGYTAGKKGYKYYALGEPMCFLFYGPMMALGGYMALTGKFSLDVMLAAMPMGFLVAAILNGNNFRDIDDDRASKIRTLPIVLGRNGARILYSGMDIAAYAAIALLVYFGIVPAWSYLTFLTLPMAGNLISIVYGNDRAKWKSLDLGTAKLHLAFGLVYLASFYIGK